MTSTNDVINSFTSWYRWFFTTFRSRW